MKTYLNDLGIINAIGDDKKKISQALLNNTTGLTTKKTLISERTTITGNIFSELPHIPRHLKEFDCRNNQAILHACLQISPSIQNMINKYGADRVAVVLGTSTSGIDNAEHAMKTKDKTGIFPSDFNYKQQETSSISEFVQSYFKLKNVAYAISTACSSSGKALISADRLLKQNICDAVIVGGCDTLCELTLNGFDCLGAVSQDICKPFHKNRDGINIGECAAVFIMSRESSEIQFMGGGESSDGHHITAPDPTGNGAAAAMNMALNKADLKSSQIGYLNLHGTATKLNDSMETNAVKRVFNDYASDLPCTSTKSLTGHTLGAAGATEAALCWLLLSHKYNPYRKLPKQYNSNHEIIEEIGIITSDVNYDKPYFMSNSFAFGGNNVSVILGRP
jgi:3-oxoacyl-[acyl-carrier-protein] synthase-1